MNLAAIYHRPESEFAFLYTKEEMRIRIRTAAHDIKSVTVVFGDPYQKVIEYQELPMEKLLATQIHQFWGCAVKAPFHRLNYAFIIEDFSGEQVFFGDQGIESVTVYEESNELMGSNHYFKMPYFQEIDRFKAIDWVKDTVWYQIFPERFANGDAQNDPENVLPWDAEMHPTRTDFFGGDLRGIIEKLDYLEELGVNGLYLCPIFEAPSNHKYDTADYKKVDVHFGDASDFKELVDKCHERGMKVMLDAVFNHTGIENPMFQDVVKNGEQSKYADWFHIQDFPINIDKANYETFAFEPQMPKLNTTNPDVQEYLLDIATYWIREFDIDAWRLDVANEIDHQFWKLFKKACEQEKEDFYLVGEIWTSAQSWLHGDEFTGVMNYAFSEAIIDYFAKEKIPLAEMVSRLNQQLMLNRDQTNAMMFNLLDSHDTKRILTLCQNDKDLLQQIFAFLFLQIGTPNIYYGTEIGLDGDSDPDNRKPMQWDVTKQDRTLFNFFKEWIAFRKTNATLLTEGKLEWTLVDEETGCFQIKRTLGDQQLLGTFNTGKDAIHVATKDSFMRHLATEDGELLCVAPKGFVISKGK